MLLPPLVQNEEKRYSLFSAAFALPAFVKHAVAFLKLF